MDFEKELTDIRRHILTMGANVEQRIGDALAALFNRDHDLALKVRTSDREINAMEVDIEEKCLRVLALSHPVASDLRFVLAVMRINANFERIGDMAKGIAKRILDLLEMGFYDIPEPLERMASEARGMLSDAIASLADENAELARRVRASDDRVDDLQREVFAWVRNEIEQNVKNTEIAIDFLSIGRKLERLADLATNISEDVIFLSEGALIRHKRQG